MDQDNIIRNMRVCFPNEKARRFCWTKIVFFLSVKTELLVDFEPKLKWDLIVILNNILWVHILLSEENNVVYSFAQIE